MSKKIDHFEALFDSTYLRWFDLNDSPALVEIVKVESDVAMTLPGGAKSKRPVVHMKLVNGKIQNMKPMVLNKTNGNTIAGIHGVKPSTWSGKEVVLFKDKTQCKGKTVDCIRIRAKKGQANG